MTKLLQDFIEDQKKFNKQQKEFQKLKLEQPEEQKKLENSLDLIKMLLDSYKILIDNIKLIEQDKQPNIKYRQYAGNIMASIEIAPKSGSNLVQHFKDIKIPPNPKILQYIDDYKEILNTIEGQKGEKQQNLAVSLLKKITFMDTFLGHRSNIKDCNVIPPEAAQVFTKLLLQNISPQSGASDVYGRAVFIGDALQRKYGHWVPTIESVSKKEIQLEKREESISLHVVIGRLFVQNVSTFSPLFTPAVIEGLHLSRLVLATSQEGELFIPIQKSQAEFQASFKALVEYVRNHIRVLNETRNPKIDFQVNNDDFIQLKNLYLVLKQFPELFDNQKVVEIISDTNQKVQLLLDDNIKLRQALSVLQNQYNNDKGESLCLQLQPVERTEKENIQLKKDLDKLAYLAAAFDCITNYKQKQFELLHDQDQTQDKDLKRKQYLAQLDDNLNETENYYKTKLLSDKAISKQFQVSSANLPVIPQKKVKVQIILDTKTVQQAEVQLAQTIAVKPLGNSISLGADLSIDLPKPLSSFTNHEKKLPLLEICVQIGSFSQKFSPPTSLGEYSSAYDVSTQNLEFTIGYYICIRGAGYNPNAPQKQLKYQYDPNMNFQIKATQIQKGTVVEEDKDKKLVMRTSKMYKGGNFMAYKSVLQNFYDLNKQGTKDYDEQDYINMLEKTTAKSMHIIEDRKYTQQGQNEIMAKPWLSFDCVWKGPNNEPLFIPQYLSAMKQLYEDLQRIQGQVPQQLEILWVNTPWENPFIPRPIMWGSRSLYPVRMLARPKGREIYEQYVEEFGESSDEQNDNKDNTELESAPSIKGLTTKKDVKVAVQIDSMFPFPNDNNMQYFLTTVLNGSGGKSQSTDPQSQISGIVMMNQTLLFDAPLPEVLDGDKLIGYDDSDESLAQMPYSIKVFLYSLNTDKQSYLNIGQLIIPLKSVFLQGEIKGELMLSDTVKVRMTCAFSPPRMPVVSKKELYFSNCEYNSYSKELPRNMAQVYQQIQMLPTRHAEPCEVEIDFLSQRSVNQKYQYLMKYATRIPYFKRGINLFIQTPSNDLLFINDFVLPPAAANQLCSFLKIDTALDAVKFAISIPFVPDTVARYYIEGKFQQFQPETRLNFEQVLALSGGDYFEHACILQACLQSSGKNMQAYVARVCTQSLTNEYFVLCIKIDEITIIDPCSGRGYIIFKDFGPDSQEKLITQTYITKIIEVFDAKEIYINLQPDLAPCFTDFDLKNKKFWACIQHLSLHADVDYKKYFFADKVLEINDTRINQLEELRKEEVVQIVRDYIKENRDKQITTFNDQLAELLEQAKDQNAVKSLEKFQYTQFVIECPYEDSAILLEKVFNSTIFMNNDPMVQFAIVCKLKAFGLKFGYLKLDIYALVKKIGGGEGTQQRIEPRGSRFGTGW